jgi:preprotein translocase subunit SecG
VPEKFAKALYKAGGFRHIPRPMLPIFINLLLVVHVIVSLLIVLVVLMQRPKSEGLGAAFGGGMTDNLFGAQTTNVLQNFTRWLAGIFCGMTLLLSVLYAKQNGTKSEAGAKLLAQPPVAAEASPSPSPAPVVSGTKSAATPAPTATATPSPTATATPMPTATPAPTAAPAVAEPAPIPPPVTEATATPTPTPAATATPEPAAAKKSSTAKKHRR